MSCNNIHRLYCGSLYRNSIKKRIQSNLKHNNVHSSISDITLTKVKTPSKPPPTLFNNYNNNNIVSNNNKKHFRNKTQLIGNNSNNNNNQSPSSLLNSSKRFEKGSPVLLLLDSNNMNKSSAFKSNYKPIALTQIQTPTKLSPVNSNNNSIVNTNNSNRTKNSANSKEKICHHRKTLSLELGLNDIQHNKQLGVAVSKSLIHNKGKSSKIIRSDNGNNVVNIVNGVNDKNVEINFNKFEIKILPDNDNITHTNENRKLLASNNTKRTSISRLSEHQSNNNSIHCDTEIAPITSSPNSMIKVIKRKPINNTLKNNRNSNNQIPSTSNIKQKHFTVTTTSAQILSTSPNIKENNNEQQTLTSNNTNTKTHFNLLIPCRQNNIVVPSPLLQKRFISKRQSFNKEILIQSTQTNNFVNTLFNKNHSNKRRMTFTQSTSLDYNFNKVYMKNKYKEGDSLNSGGINSINVNENNEEFQPEQDNNNVYKNKKQVNIYQQNSSFLNNKTHTNNTNQTFGKNNSNNNNYIYNSSPSKNRPQEQILFELNDHEDNNNNNSNANNIVKKELQLSLKEFETSSTSSNGEDNKNKITSNFINTTPSMKKDKNTSFFVKRSLSNYNTSPFLYGKGEFQQQKKRTNVLSLLSSTLQTPKNKKDSNQMVIQPLSQNRFFQRNIRNAKSQKKIIKKLSNIPEIFIQNKEGIELNTKLSKFDLLQYHHNNCNSSCKLQTNFMFDNVKNLKQKEMLNKSVIVPPSKQIFDDLIDKLNESSFKVPNSSSYSSSRESSFDEDTFSDGSRKTGNLNLNSVSFSKQGPLNFLDKRSLSVMPFNEMKFVTHQKNHTEKDLNTLKKLQNQIDDVYQSIFDNNATVEIKESLLNKSLLAIDIKCDVFQEKRESTIKQLTNKKMSETIITELTKEQFFDEDTPEENELFEIALHHSCNKHLQRDFSNNLSAYTIQTFFEVDIYKNIFEEKYLETELGESITINMNLPNNQIIAVNTLFDNFKFYRLPTKARSTIALFKRKSKKTLLSKTILPINSQISLVQFSQHLWHLLMHNKVEALPYQDKQFYWSFVIKDCIKNNLDSKSSNDYLLKANESLQIQRKQKRELTKKSPMKKYMLNRTSTTTNMKRRSIGFLNLGKRGSCVGFNKIFESQNTLFHTSNVLNNHKKDFSILNTNKYLYDRGYDDHGNLSYDDNPQRIKHKRSFALTGNQRIQVAPIKQKKRFSFSYSVLPSDKTNEDRYSVKKERIVYRTNEIKFGLLKGLNSYIDYLFFYIKDGNAEKFRDVFLKYKINPETKDKDGNTFLNLAVQCDCLKIVLFLINHGANVNTQNRKMNTPLHYALSYQNFMISDLLIKSGANEKIKNLKGVTPWQCLKNTLSIM